MSKTLTFAPGWTQTINTSNEVDERNDLLSYISDTYKGLYGFRPRGDTSNMTIEDLREEAAGLERDVLREAEYIKKEYLRKKREKGTMMKDGTVIDPITRQKAEGAMQDLGNIWVAIEPTDREELERRMSASHERARFLAAEDVRADDLIGEYEVIRSDPQLGLKIGFLTY